MNLEKLVELGPWGVVAAVVTYLFARLIAAGFTVSIKVGEKR